MTTDEFPEIWTTLDGRKLKVSEMDEHHVRAALNMVIRRSRRSKALREFLRDYEMRNKHDIGFDDAWPELNTSDSGGEFIKFEDHLAEVRRLHTALRNIADDICDNTYTRQAREALRAKS